jgi:hypothetical protein
MLFTVQFGLQEVDAVRYYIAMDNRRRADDLLQMAATASSTKKNAAVSESAATLTS